ncbi:unnamed protein product [marine sediment metagenome]|uniref:DUF4143 domain-containing protein n=1 Tax=marine sediment metagenome TaxID=412755 RepID=X0ZXV1_9ZZZZ
MLLNSLVGYEIGTWRYAPKSDNETGVQIDLLLDRDDGIINIIEIKLANKPYRITKQYASSLGDKIDVFKEHLSTDKTIFLTLVTLHGILPNKYSDQLVDNDVTFDDLI